MSISLQNVTGSGHIVDDSIISYSYSEDVTSLEPGNLNGGTGQVSVSAGAVSGNKVGNTHPNSALMINNKMLLTDDIYGSVNFYAKQVNVENGVVSIVGDTIQSRLNVEVTAGPVGNSSSLYDAIIYYCGLVDITPTIDSAFAAVLDAKTVNFIGWKANLWEQLKALCAAVSASATEDIGIEMFVDLDTLVFRQALSTPVAYSDDNNLISRKMSVETFDAARDITVSNYATSYKTNAIVKETEGRAEIAFPLAKEVSISDNMQVEAGETVRKRFKINASLSSVNQPTCVAAITSLPYTGTTGEYVIVGTDNLPIQPAQWTAQGGSLTVALTENPNEIEITVIAPLSPNLPKDANPSEVGYAPYKIGVESSGEADYPALWITGTGVFYDKKDIKLLTGASEDYTAKQSGSPVDNIFLTSLDDVSSRGVAAAQALCGPNITLDDTVVGNVSFGTTPGQVKDHEGNKFRITSASYGLESTGITLKSYAKFSDFEAIWDGLTFADFTAVALDPATYPSDALTFNEFSIIPLMEAN